MCIRDRGSLAVLYWRRPTVSKADHKPLLDLRYDGTALRRPMHFSIISLLSKHCPRADLLTIISLHHLFKICSFLMSTQDIPLTAMRVFRCDADGLYQVGQERLLWNRSIHLVIQAKAMSSHNNIYKHIQLNLFLQPLTTYWDVLFLLVTSQLRLFRSKMDILM